jgi:hypothetical protein
VKPSSTGNRITTCASRRKVCAKLFSAKNFLAQNFFLLTQKKEAHENVPLSIAQLK